MTESISHDSYFFSLFRYSGISLFRFFLVMTVTASAAAAAVVLVVVTFTVATTTTTAVAAASTATTTASAAAACRIKFFFGSIAHTNNFNIKVQRFSGKLVISVYSDFIAFNFCNTYNRKSRRSHHLERHADFNFAVKLKLRAVNFYDKTFIIFAIAVFWLNVCRKLISRFMTSKKIFKAGNKIASSVNIT